MKEKILEVKNLEVSFKTYAGISHAVRGIDFNLHKGETLAIVGESGCGKTVSSKAIMRLLPESNTIIGENSEVLFHGEDLLKKSENEMVSIRGSKISMIFQDPMTSLNPTMKIGDQIAESILIHRQISKEEAYKEALEMLQLVKIPNAEKRMKQYPFEFSGGMRHEIRRKRTVIDQILGCCKHFHIFKICNIYKFYLQSDRINKFLITFLIIRRKIDLEIFRFRHFQKLLQDRQG